MGRNDALVAVPQTVDEHDHRRPPPARLEVEGPHPVRSHHAGGTAAPVDLREGGGKRSSTSSTSAMLPRHQQAALEKRLQPGEAPLENRRERRRGVGEYGGASGERLRPIVSFA